MAGKHDDIDSALETLTEAKAAQDKLHLALDALEHARCRKPIEKLYIKPARTHTKDDFIRVVIPDTHGNKIARHAAAAMLADIKDLNPDEVVLLGDHLDCGGFLAQNHVMGYVAEIAETGYEADVTGANDFLDLLIKAAPTARIHYLQGNHEHRTERWCVTQSLRHSRDAAFLLSLVGPEAVLRLEDRGITYYKMDTRYNDLPVPGIIKLGECLFTHGFSTARAAATAHAAAAGMNIVYGHTHRHQADMVRTVAGGVFGAWSPGCMAQLQQYYEHSSRISTPTGTEFRSVQEAANSFTFKYP